MPALRAEASLPDLPEQLRFFKRGLVGACFVLMTLSTPIAATAAVSIGPHHTNAVAAEEQRVLQFHQAEQLYQTQLKVARERCDQKQIYRAKVIAAMSSELQTRQQTVVISPLPAQAPPAAEPAGWFRPSLAMAALVAGFAGFRCYINRRPARDAFGRNPRPDPETVSQPVPDPVPQVVERSLAEETFFCNSLGANGRGLYAIEGFVVLKGSVGRKENDPALVAKVTESLRVNLFDSGVMREEGEAVIFEQDHLFPSPSIAAIALLGRTVNGWLEWKTEDGITLETVERMGARRS